MEAAQLHWGPWGGGVLETEPSNHVHIRLQAESIKIVVN